MSVDVIIYLCLMAAGWLWTLITWAPVAIIISLMGWYARKQGYQA